MLSCPREGGPPPHLRDSATSHEKIAKIVNDINPNAKMMLINVIYFKGKYQERFAQKITYFDTFFILLAKLVKLCSCM